MCEGPLKWPHRRVGVPNPNSRGHTKAWKNFARRANVLSGACACASETAHLCQPRRMPPTPKCAGSPSPATYGANPLHGAGEDPSENTRSGWGRERPLRTRKRPQTPTQAKLGCHKPVIPRRHLWLKNRTNINDLWNTTFLLGVLSFIFAKFVRQHPKWGKNISFADFIFVKGMQLKINVLFAVFFCGKTTPCAGN